MFDSEVKKWFCDCCTKDSGNENRDKTSRVMVANVIVAEVCNACRPAAIAAITALRTQESAAFYDAMTQPVDAKRFGPPPKAEPS